MMSIFSGLPPEVIVFLLSMVPVGELRAALPVAIVTYSFPLSFAIPLVLAGNMVPVVIVFGGLPPIERFARAHVPKLDEWLQRYFRFLEAKHAAKYRKWGWIFLLLFVAVPLPGSGAWSGSVLAYLLKLDQNKSILAIFGGLCISSVIVFLITTGAIKLFV